MAQHRVSVKLVGRNCEHDLCVPISREVPPDLRCKPDQPGGYGAGGGVTCGCRVPENLSGVVMSELRDDLQKWRRLGFVRIDAA